MATTRFPVRRPGSNLPPGAPARGAPVRRPGLWQARRGGVPPEPPPARPFTAWAPGEADVQKTIEMLEEHDRRMAISILQIGHHVFQTYFGGDELLARSKDPKKPATYAELARRAAKETSWNQKALYTAVIAYLVSRTIPPELLEAIPPTYLWRLDGIEGIARLGLAERIAAGELRGNRAIRTITAAGGVRRGGRPPKPAPLSIADELDRAMARAREVGAFEKAQLERLAASGPGTLRSLATRLSAHAAAVEAVAASARALAS